MNKITNPEYLLYIYYIKYKERRIYDLESIEHGHEIIEAQIPLMGGVRKWVIKKVYGSDVESKVLWEKPKEETVKSKEL